MRITFITGHLCKERHALLNELAKDLGEYGAEVTVLSGYPSRRISNKVRQYYLAHPVEKISKNVVVKRIGTKKGEGNGLLERMFKYLFLTRELYKAAANTPTDVFYLYSSPPFLGYIGCKLAKIAPTVYNAQDLFPDTLVHMKHISEKNPFIKFFRKKEATVYKKNTRIVTISEEMKRTIATTDELGIDKKKFIVSYAGDIGLFQGWDVILDAAKILINDNPEIHFAIIGSGSYKPQLEKRITEEKITNVSVHPLQPANRLSEIYSIGDVELVPIEKGITKMALPSKTGVIMATGSPILALVDNGSDIEQIINGREIGIAIEHGNAEKLADAINLKIKICCRNSEEMRVILPKATTAEKFKQRSTITHY